MSQDITADAVPIKDHDRIDPIAQGGISTEPTLAFLSEQIEESCCDRMDNIALNNESLTMVEPMGESSDSNDSNGAESRITHYQEKENIKNNSKTTEENHNTRNNHIQNQIVIQNPTGIVHLGPTYNISVGQAFTQVNANKTSAAESPSSNSSGEKEPSVDENTPSKEYMRPLWYSTRVMERDELLRLSKNIGSNWKSVGNGLKFNWAQLDQFEKDTKCLSDAVHRMLFRWLQWKDQKATVGRLTKVLFNHKEFDAIRCLSP